MGLNHNAPTVSPVLRYRDAQAALRFLTDTLGLALGHLSKAPDGRIAHAELGWGNGIIMISGRGAEPSPFDTERSCLYLVVEDPDALHDRVVAAGGTIVMPLVDQEYGSREFATEDPEGNIWCFGTYQPAPISDSATEVAAP
jgi:uncharacterized glyoxalase superfamily protein PhnB